MREHIIRRRTGRFTRCFAALLALLLLLTCPVPIPVRAASEISADRDDITVLSLTVNVNTETKMVTTELILSNTGSEDAELTFPLPEISAGIDGNALTVKTKDGQDVKVDNGVVTLNVPAGGYAGLSYAYKTKKNLSYERTIGFDLRQLSKQFNDRIGHIEWTVDMPLYELVLVKDIQPVSYTVEDNRVSVVLDDLIVSRLLNRISLTRTTHLEIINGNHSENEDEAIEVGEVDRTATRFIAKNYKNWYKDPDIGANAVFIEDGWIDYDLTFIKMYIDQTVPEEERESQFEKYRQWKTSGEQLEEDEIIQKYKGLYYTTSTWTTKFLFEGLFWDVDPHRAPVWNDMEAPALYSRNMEEKPSVLIVLYTLQPELKGKTTVLFSEDEWNWRLKSLTPIDEVSLLKMTTSRDYYGEDMNQFRVISIWENEYDDPEQLRSFVNAIHAKVIVRSQIVMKDSEIGRELVSTSGDGWTRINDLNFGYDETPEYSFAAFEEDYRSIDEPNYYVDWTTLVPCEEPLKNAIPVPILTQYWGYAYPVEELIDRYGRKNEEIMESMPDYEDEYAIKAWKVMNLYTILGGPQENAYVVEQCYLNMLECEEGIHVMIAHAMDRPGAKKVLDARDAAMHSVIEATEGQIVAARAELNLPAAEVLLEALSAGDQPTDAPTEAPTEVTTEPPTEVPTSEPTETTTEASTEETAEVPAQASTEDIVTSAAPTSATISEETTSAAAPEETTRMVEDAQATGGNGLLIALIIALAVVGLGGTTAAVIKLKKNKKNE